MSTYVISDIHGQYDTFMRMLKQIKFCEEDTLYILGDAIDRGPDGIKILKAIMKMKNVKMFLGNHELLMMEALRNVDECEHEGREDTDELDLWLDECNGGRQTFEDFKKCSAKKKAEILIYLDNSIVAKKVKIGRKTYYLCHAYMVNKKFDDEVKYNELIYKDVYQAVWQNIYDAGFVKKLNEKIFPNKKYIYVLGHIFTQRLDNIDEEGAGMVLNDPDFLGEYHIINIDCGMALRNKSSRLACIRLEDEKIYYEALDV
ncbi:MAG: fructose-bisphosphatase class III [Lachnospiraceae bacterium]|nr:fructose-bisphosphatase class III [Lachnospiraceae bacterium]